MGRAFLPADILLPHGADMEKWAVIACDQHTGQPEYWERVEKNVGEASSTLKLIFPEVYLGESDAKERISEIHNEMKKYVSGNLFTEYKNSLFYIERTLSDGAVRQGIVGMIDLDEYDYHAGSTSLVRATEATVPDRLPPRIEIRKDALLELPHVMTLIDDEQHTVIEPCARAVSGQEPLYDFDLMEKGGSIRGYFLTEEAKKRVFEALGKLGDPDAFNRRYGLENAPVLLYAVGDGNHSLAAAKGFYEQLKAENPDKDFSNHPARYALTEIVNLHSPALEFEAIQRIVKKVDTQDFMEEMIKALELSDEPAEQHFTVVLPEGERDYFIHKPLSQLTVGSVQSFLDDYKAQHGCKIDYIHGSDVVRELSRQENTVGFLLPDMKKSELYPTVIKDGVLPRKTFSMGHARDKRYYIESRIIKEQ